MAYKIGTKKDPQEELARRMRQQGAQLEADNATSVSDPFGSNKAMPVSGQFGPGNAIPVSGQPGANQAIFAPGNNNGYAQKFQLANEAVPVSSNQQGAIPVSSNNSGYAPSQTVQDYQKRINDTQSQKPADYTSKYQAGIDQLFEKILNRGKFEYDMNADKLYQQAMDKYSQQAKMGMQDTMGQAQAMTGGYGNSYAQTAGQQMYDKTMQNVTDMLPAMEDRAYARWSGEGDEMARNLAMSQGMEQNEYGRYRDTVGDWQFDSDRAFNQYNTERGFDYGMYQDRQNSEFQREQFEYDKGRDTSSDEFQREQFEHKKQQDAAAAAFQQQQWEAQQARAGSRSGSKPPPNYSDEEISLFEQMLAEEEAKKKIPLQQLYDPYKGTSGGYWR